jgi:hypothetical protein
LRGEGESGFRRKAWASNVAALLHSPCTATHMPSLAST